MQPARYRGIAPVSYTHLDVYKRQLQQDAFDNIDGSTSMERQQYMLNMVLDVIRSDFDFDSFEEVNPYFKRIINTFKQMNYCLLYTSYVVPVHRRGVITFYTK